MHDILVTMKLIGVCQHFVVSYTVTLMRVIVTIVVISPSISLEVPICAREEKMCEVRQEKAPSESLRLLD